jgi:hypothetical protein
MREPYLDLFSLTPRLLEGLGAEGTRNITSGLVKGPNLKLRSGRPQHAFQMQIRSADGPHQFRTRNELNKTQRTRSITDENAGKSTITTVILPLITVRLQVRVLPGPP